jgi:hypothetical protein
MGSTPVWRAILEENFLISGLSKFDRYRLFREVAQLGRALGLGPRGRRFESCLPDHDLLTILGP